MNTSRSHVGLAEAARRLGVSGKALRLYEARGLVRPERTRAGWRVYGPEQIARLHQVLALKSFGLPLGRIAELLAGRLADLEGFLALHEQVLRRDLAALEHALLLLAAARATLAARGSLSPDDLLDLTRNTVMTDRNERELADAYQAVAAKHFSAADQAALDINGYRGMDKPDPDWGPLHGEAARLMRAGDPASPEAMDLARRWMGKVFEATGGDPALTLKLKAVARETLEQPAFEGAAGGGEMMDFVARAYGAAIAAGVMPAP